MRIIIVGLCLCCLFIVSNCKKESSPEEKIRDEFYQIRDFVEQRKIGKIMDYISSEYKDTYGNRKESIKAILIQNIMFRKGIKVVIRDIDVKINGSNADVTLKLFLSEGSSVIPENADVMILKCNMVSVDDIWLITSAHWEGHQSPF